jgi:glycosyltransferase involved in cell wall biosynthesis
VTGDEREDQCVDGPEPPVRVTFVYRGQLTVERSRLEFLLAAVCQAFTEVDAVMLSPGMGATAEEFEAFARVHPNVRNCSFLEAGRWRRGRARRALLHSIADDARRTIGVGFSVAPYLPRRSSQVWCVNGIPEERLLHRHGLLDRVVVRVAWESVRRWRPALTVAVSGPMAQLMTERVGGATLAVPNTVDRSVFRADPSEQPRYLTYQGGGSPWQGLDRLAEVWRELHVLEPELRFRVVTRDPRAHVLASRLPGGVVDVEAATDPAVVAGLLREARLGFLMREPTLVNEVSWPMKLGEYLAAGAPVVVTRCGWDAERLIERHGAGLVVDWDTPPHRTARQILHYLDELGADQPLGVEAAAEELDELRWLDRLGYAMRDAVESADDRARTS